MYVQSFNTFETVGGIGDKKLLVFCTQTDTRTDKQVDSSITPQKECFTGV